MIIRTKANIMTGPYRFSVDFVVRDKRLNVKLDKEAWDRLAHSELSLRRVSCGGT